MKNVWLFLLFSGCMVGPKYHKPEVALPEQFIENPQIVADEFDEQDLIDWWKQLEDPFLDELLTQTCSSNFDLRIALEQILQARFEFQSETAKLFPQFNLDAAAVRTRQSLDVFTPISTASASGAETATPSPIRNFFQVGFDALWEMDFFGRLRHARKAAYFTWQSIQEQARNILITVMSEVANNYVAICTYQNLLDLAREKLWVDSQELELSISLFEAGLIDASEVLGILSIIDQDKSAIFEQESTLKQTIYRLAVLLGENPEDLAQDFEKTRPIPVASGKIPPGLPSELLRRRPDIRSAERQIAAATEQVGVAVADLFPKVYLTATNLFAANPSGSNIGWGGSKLHQLFHPRSLTWSIGPAFSWPFFDFGKRRAVVKAQTSIQKQTLLAYEKTVITALEEVESALIALAKQELRLSSFSHQVLVDTQAFELAQDRYTAGLDSYQQVLKARKKLILSEATLVQNQQSLTARFIAVHKALGGDWQCSSLQ
ncbi:MAG: efflux transporter outer membrane subunit [Chlamydiales bacterium]|nr:efflux transporter outer membrane subunit [Chlamydiales bacterium]